MRNAIYRVQDKLGIESKQEIVVWAVRNGLLDGSRIVKSNFLSTRKWHMEPVPPFPAGGWAGLSGRHGRAAHPPGRAE